MEPQLFKFKGQQVRTVTIDEEPYFVGKDVAEILGYKDLNRAVNQHVDREDRKSLSRKDSGDSCATLWPTNDWTNKVIITESGVYSLIFNSALPQAKEFKHWVTSEVLPSIRKHGAYLTDKTAYDITHSKEALGKLLMQAGQRLIDKNREIEALSAELEVANKKANYVDVIIDSKDDITITQVAQDYGMGAVSFNKLLKELGVQRKVNNQWILYAKHQGKGYIASRAVLIPSHDGRVHTKINTTWTQKGRLFLYELLKANNILPLIEREGDDLGLRL
ncbi:phage antirepressor [Limosilactobacillus fermentum]|uniref:phage antirepressor n=1 Tax=Limosilactobacillus fermentum TaxID=1613 RepID=UPI0030053134